MNLAVLCPNPACSLPWTIASSGEASRCPHCGLSLRLSWETLEQQASVTTLNQPRAADSFVLEAGCGDPTPMPDVPPGALTLTPPDLVPATAASAVEHGPIDAAQMPLRLGRFEVRRFLGEGAFGRVFEAYDPQLDRFIALKVAKLDAGDSPERAQRFLREARAAANLRHAHIVPVFDAGRQADLFYIASAIITGKTLERQIKDRRPALPESVAIVAQIAEALAYAHQRGVVHRDVKPENILLDEEGQALLTDFGVAFRRDEERLTRQGALVGTPQYMSPEQARGTGGEVLAASDQYSLGVVFYELLTGRTPFSGSPISVLHDQMECRPAAPRSLQPATPRDLEEICLRTLEKDPQRRYGDCAELAQVLRSWLGQDEAKRPAMARRGDRAAAKPRASSRRRSSNGKGQAPRHQSEDLVAPTTGSSVLNKVALGVSLAAACLAAAAWLFR